MSIILQDQLTLSTKTKEQVEKNTQDIAKNTQDIEDLEEKIAVVYKFKGSVDTYAELPTEDNQTGDVWDVKADDMNYAWTADGEWDQLGPTVDLSGYVPTSRTINNKTLESDITLEPSDIGAATAAQGELADTALQSEDLKTINGTSIVGEGDIVITTNYSFKDTWTTNSTTNTFLNDVYTDEDAIPGMTYLGELTCSDLPAGLNNAEALVEVMPSATAAEKVIHVVITSGNLSPYRWELTYWVIGNTPHNSGWIAFQPQITSSNKLNSDLVTDTNQTNKFVTASEKTTWSGKQDILVSGTNIKTVNNTSLLGEGNITIDSLPSQTGNADKFLTTDGTNASWADIVTDLENLSDVNITSPTNGQALIYNSATSKFENGTVLSDIKLTDIAMEGTNVTFGYDMQNNYSVQGNAVTISDAGVATGFTTNDYIYKGDGMWNSVCAAGSFEFGIKFKLNTLSNDNYLASIIYASYTGDMKFGLRVDRYGSIQLAINNSMSNAVISPSSNLSTNTWYWVKVVANQNEQVKLYLSTNGTDYNLAGTTTNSYDFTSSTSTYPFILGAYIIYSGTKCSLNGSIDLTETYFKDANGNSLWKPIGLQSEKMFINATDTTYSDFIGATSLVAGTAGLVPAPAATDNEKFLRGDGTWQEVQSGSQPTYDAATRTITF